MSKLVNVSKAICSIDTCLSTVHGHGYCQKHYARQRRYGSPEIVKLGRHGKKKTTEYYSWCHMKERCYSNKDKRYAHYGGRGIKVCDRWFNSFENFLEDMGNRPENLTLERIDNDGDYEPSNCKWATVKEQIRNRSTSRYVIFQGKRRYLEDLCEELGFKRGAVDSRLSRGWSIKDALSLPINKVGKNFRGGTV